MRQIGSHVSFGNDGLNGAVREAHSYGANTFMVYTGAPQNTVRRPIDDAGVQRAWAMMQDHKMNSFVVHAPYIINLASYKSTVWELAVQFLQEEIRRTHQLGVTHIVLHPGAYTDKDRTYGIARIAEGLKEVLAGTADTPVKIALETMAGKGTEIGRQFAELASIFSLLADDARLCVCMDTCHVHDAGYDIVGAWDDVVAEFDATIGLGRLAVLHLNDSKNMCGAAKDRHAPLGAGWIGFEAMARIFSDVRVQHVPMILETPWIGKQKADVRPMYPVEIALLLRDVPARLGETFIADVERLAHGLAQQEVTTQTVRVMWQRLREDVAFRKADPREPMERLYDLVIAQQWFPHLNEEQIHQRLIGFFANVHRW